MPRPLRVFLCHASQDKPAVRKLHRYLKQRGVQPWLDELDLLPGEYWEVEIPNALFASDVILVCLSKNSVNKEGFVQKEITFALDKAQEKPEGTIFIIPVKLEDCDVPKRLSRYHWVDLFRPDGYKRLMLGLNKRAISLGSDVAPIIAMDETRPKPASTQPEKIDLQKAEQEAREKAERERAEKAAREKLELEALEKAKREKAEREAVELVAREDKEKAMRETAEKIAREKREREAKEKIVREEKPAPVSRNGIPTKDRIATSYSKNNPTYANFRLLGIGSIILLVLICGWFGLNYFINHLPVATATSTPKVISTPKPPTVTSVPFTSTPQPTETLIPTPTSSNMTGNDGMILLYVPAGEFLMGSPEDTLASTDEKPQHSVTLDAYWIDQTEVTVRMYFLCVMANVCKEPTSKSSATHTSYYGSAEFDNYPIMYVDWNMANTYCKWAGRRLPTEAEWEKAARGPDANIYPWGNDAPNKELLNYNNNIGDTTEVGKYPNGKSFYGAYDMAGNVWEWVSSLYQPYPYNANDGRENLSSLDARVLRGGSWDNSDYNVRSAYRLNPNLSYNNLNFGFRCARSLP